ncbi:hypothetical protein BBJ28_00013417 [Nothophytophthora sp. Chile5]|nr:hypothetical protein BBJ28_00013417 [Nothophytophthora sp. Chile5]
MKLEDRGEDAAASAIRSIQEAEFAVLGSIAVREQHKAKLRALLQRIDPLSWPNVTPKERKGGVKGRQKAGDLQLPMIPEGKEVYVLGDLLLLTRAASAAVVESVEKWRAIVHQDKPQPFVHEHENYLLSMCEDLDFLDQSEDLVDWLGFRLRRNPFLVADALDQTISRRLHTDVHKSRTLKHSRLKGQQETKARWRQPPPQPLVKPVASILPEDDVVDGSRIAAAQELLLDEESFHGRLVALKAAREYVATGASTLGWCEGDSQASKTDFPTVYDAIAALNTQSKYVRCRDAYRQGALKTYHKLDEELQRCLAVLKEEESSLATQLDKHKSRMNALRLDKRQEEAARREGIRKKTMDRSRTFQSKKLKPPKRPEAVVDPLPCRSRPNNSSSDQEIVIRAFTASDSAGSGGIDGDYDLALQLESKRQRAIHQKHIRREQQTRLAMDNELLLDRRRAENVDMKLEDALSRAVEQRARLKTRLRSQKARRDRLASCALFKCMHEMNGKRFLVSVYPRNARGYELEGLRIVAYDPSSSATFTLLMSLREYTSLGYGHSSEGLAAFCKWLCLLFEKRRRQFRLVWSGTPCPPPLRVREDDEALVCVHKAGVKMRGYSLVAVYLRTDELSTVRFVVSCWNGLESLLTEHSVAASRLVLGSDLDIQWEASDHGFIVWKHRIEDLKAAEEVVERRVYSGEVIVAHMSYTVHIYDTNATEYTVKLAPKRWETGASSSSTAPQRPQSPRRLVLLKRDVNPYGVQLPSSSFTDLLSLTRFESVSNGGTRAVETDGHDAVLGWKAEVSSKWLDKLSRYVRVLRLAKYATKVGGVFCFVVISIVQQKTEFRAHLLLELTFSSGGSGVATRQSLCIALSDYLRCSNASRRFLAGLEGCSVEGEDVVGCPGCLAYVASHRPFEDLRTSGLEAPSSDPSCCSGCASMPSPRLRAIRELILYEGSIASEALEQIYQSHCEICGVKTPPLVLVVGPAFPSAMEWLLPFLEHYFVCFDCSSSGFLRPAEIADENDVSMRDTFRQTLMRGQVAVLFNADCGVTVASANAFVHELHWGLYPEHHALPFHVAYVIEEQRHHHGNGALLLDLDGRRDQDVMVALQAMAEAANQVGELHPVQLDSVDAEGGDSAAAFEAYLVAEAVLVEATRVLLHPEIAWQKPRKIVGASSWNSACRFLQDPLGLSAELQRCRPLELNSTTAEVVDAYFSHVHWPHDYPDVRPVFHGLLAFLLHVEHVRQAFTARSGSLQAVLNSQQDTIYRSKEVNDAELLAPNTSVLDCTRSVGTAETLLMSQN